MGAPGGFLEDVKDIIEAFSLKIEFDLSKQSSRKESKDA